MNRALAAARRFLPVAISAGFLLYLAHRIDWRAALDRLTLDTALRFIGPLAVWNFVTLAIEAQCLHRVTAACGAAVDRITAARIKSACYLLSLLHYAAGATALAFLVRRRTGTPLSEAASAVFVIALLDMGSVAGLALVAGALAPEATGALRSGLLALLLAGLAAGFVLLRSRWPIGPLEAVRTLPILRAFRALATPVLAELVALRVAFVVCYVVMTGSLFLAFGVEIGPLDLALRVAVLLILSTLPIAVAGIGTAQVAFVTLFDGWASREELLSMSLLLSVTLVAARTLLGLAFAGELTREAREAAGTD